MMIPSLDGLIPRSEFMIAFSMEFSELLSKGLITSMRASGTLKLASCLRGTSEP